jgi:anaerobic selenocysteine-containing dehydrogenase
MNAFEDGAHREAPTIEAPALPGVWPARVEERTLSRPDRWIASACVRCAHGCGLDVGVRSGRIVALRGRATDPANRGRLCERGLRGFERNESRDRLTRPLLRRGGRFDPVSWDEAMNLLVHRSKDLVARSTSSAIGFLGTPRLLEEAYALSVLAFGGLGTPHLAPAPGGAGAARALEESFGTSAPPGSLDDLDTTEAIFLVGHDPASRESVLWERILDRRRGPRPPALVVLDARRTEAAREADVHLAPRPGMDLPVLNALENLLIQAGQIDRELVLARTVGFDALAATVKEYSPERAQELAGVPAERLRAAAAILGPTASLVSLVQASQATAAIQVDNLHLLRGLLGRPGSGVLHVSEAPSTREAGGDGALPGLRNRSNPEHVADLARLWNVEPERLPAWSAPSAATTILRHAEEGSIKLLWITAANPAAANLEVRRTLAKPGLFVVVQDAFLTETAGLANLVLPAALPGEKTGSVASLDRTIRLTRKAIEAPGEARSDLEILVDYARRMGLDDRDGAPLLGWRDPEAAFLAWRECTRGRPCDATGMSYERLAREEGLAWPCPEGSRVEERLYARGVFATAAPACETWGHDLVTGVERGQRGDPAGRAVLGAAHALATDAPDDWYPLWLTSRPGAEAVVQLSLEDARKHRIAAGDVVEVESRRGKLRGRALLGEVEPGLVAVPFASAGGEWDPVSQEPRFSHAAVRIRRVERLERWPAPGSGVVAAARRVATEVGSVIQLVTAERHLRHYVGLLEAGERDLGQDFALVARRHAAEPAVSTVGALLGSWSLAHLKELAPVASRLGKKRPPGRRRALAERSGSFGLLRDLHDLSVLAHEVSISWQVVGQAARALGDEELAALSARSSAETARQLAWLKARIDEAGPQALIVPS